MCISLCLSNHSCATCMLTSSRTSVPKRPRSTLWTSITVSWTKEQWVKMHVEFTSYVLITLVNVQYETANCKAVKSSHMKCYVQKDCTVRAIIIGATVTKREKPALIAEHHSMEAQIICNFVLSKLSLLFCAQLQWKPGYRWQNIGTVWCFFFFFF